MYSVNNKSLPYLLHKEPYRASKDLHPHPSADKHDTSESKALILYSSTTR